jgi:hypothetical protein
MIGIPQRWLAARSGRQIFRGRMICWNCAGGDQHQGDRIASPEMLPKPRLLPHLKCSPGDGLGDEYEEGEHGDTPGIGAGDH